MWVVLTIADILLFAIVAFTVLYILFYAISSTRYQQVDTGVIRKKGRFLFIIATNSDDTEIESTLKSLLKMEYEQINYDIVVVGCKLTPLQSIKLAQYPISLLRINKDCTKSEAHTFAIKNHQSMKIYDMVVFMSPSETVHPNFLAEVNKVLQAGIRFFQLHKRPVNLEKASTILSCAIEEINNSIFRKGHVACGLPSALSNSAIALDYNWYKNNANQISRVDGEKSMETLLIKQGIFVDYIEEVCVYQQPIKNSSVMYQSRRDWEESRFSSTYDNIKKLLPSLMRKKINISDKIIQWIMLPRIIMMFIILTMSLTLPFIYFTMAIKWWIAFLLVTFAFAVCTPDYVVERNWFKIMRHVPLLMINSVGSFFFHNSITKRISQAFHKKEK